MTEADLRAEAAQRDHNDLLKRNAPILEDLADKLEGAMFSGLADELEKSMSGSYNPGNPDGSLRGFAERYVAFVEDAAPRLASREEVVGRLDIGDPTIMTPEAVKTALDHMAAATKGTEEKPQPSESRYDEVAPIKTELVTVAWKLKGGTEVYTKVEQAGPILIFTTRLWEGTQLKAPFADHC